MAESQSDRGNMDISAHKDTWSIFTALVKWGTISAFILTFIASWMVVLVNA